MHRDAREGTGMRQISREVKFVTILEKVNSSPILIVQGRISVLGLF